MSWSNWSGRLRAEGAELCFVRSEDDAAALLAAARDRGQTVRVAGRGHSHAPLVPTDGLIIDTSGLSGVISVDVERARAWVWAGTPIAALGRPLADAGLALINQGDIDRQTIAGACATGTHGTGASLANLSAAVTGLSAALPDGRLTTWGSDRPGDPWPAARLNLGAFGMITRVELQLRAAYRLAERGWIEPYEPLAERLVELAAAHRHFEFFWFPDTDRAIAKTIDETDEPARYPLGPEGSRCAWSHEVLPNHRPRLHTEMEYSVAAHDGPACLAAIRDLIRDRFADLAWPVEYRTLAADDVWLSSAYERPTVTISVHQGVEADEGPLFRACEEVFRSFEGRPHWGKVHFLDGTTLAGLHPRWADWWAERDRVDPDRVMVNEHLAALAP